MGALVEAITGDPEGPVTVLGTNVNLKGFATAIKEGKVKNIITMSGAGISTSCGIPDFRSPKTGLYHNLEKYNLENPQDIFTLSYFYKNPEPFFTLSKELMPVDNEYKPSITHYFIKLLNDKGLLLRHYTQNIDGLEVLSGLPENKCIEAHGHYRSGTCLNCKKKYSSKYFSPQIMNNKIPKCTQNNCNGVIKPDVVFFGEGLPNKFFDCLESDFKKCDMLIIMGTSLKVHPFAGLIHKVSKTCPRLLINMQYAAKNSLSQPNRDYFLQGKCDDGIIKFAKQLGWSNEVKNMCEKDEKLNENVLIEEKKNDILLSPFGKTSLFMAAGRAIESEKENGIFNDKYAKIFATDKGFEYLKKMSMNVDDDDIDENGYSKELLKYIVLRTKWIDDRIIKSMNEFESNINKKKQIIFMGIGCDSRSYRMKCLNMNDINIFELDVEDIIKYRNDIFFNKCKIEKRENINSLNVDFRNKKWINILLDNGFNKECDTIWITEGLFSYFNMNEIDELFTIMSEYGNGKNNWIIGTILNSKTVMKEKLNSIWNDSNMNEMKFEGIDEPHLLFEKYGYKQNDIIPTGGKFEEYDKYLNELYVKKESNDKFMPDILAKSFIFLCMK
eukprot:188498_1